MNGKRTLDENIADIVGMEIALAVSFLNFYYRIGSMEIALAVSFLKFYYRIGSS